MEKPCNALWKLLHFDDISKPMHIDIQWIMNGYEWLTTTTI